MRLAFSQVGALLVASWLGAAVLFAAVVAPAAFSVLPSRALAGALVGRVLPAVFIAGLVVALLALGIGFRDGAPFLKARLLSAVLVALSCAAAHFLVGPRIERLRQTIGSPVGELAVEDERRVAFGRLHRASVGWLGAAIVGATCYVVFSTLAGRSARRGHK